MKTRVIQSAGYNGKWVLQGWFADAQVWADIGDACDSRETAEAKRTVEEGRSRMMKDLHAAWHTDDNNLSELIYSLQDGYGIVGYVPEQGYDWSGIRDSSNTAVTAMWDALQDYRRGK